MYYHKRNKLYGRLGEFLATQYYCSKGYKFVCQNLKTKFSEIDLIFSLENIIKIIEVKLTTNSDFDVFSKWRCGQLPKLTKSYQLLQSIYPEKVFQIDFINFDFSHAHEVRVNHYENIAPRLFIRRPI